MTINILNSETDNYYSNFSCESANTSVTQLNFVVYFPYISYLVSFLSYLASDTQIFLQKKKKKQKLNISFWFFASLYLSFTTLVMKRNPRASAKYCQSMRSILQQRWKLGSDTFLAQAETFKQCCCYYFAFEEKLLL